MRHHIVAVMGLLVSAAAWGQSRQVPAADQDRPIVLSGATIHTVADADPIVSGFVRIENGLITQVGAGDPTLESGDQVIDCQGSHVYPGMILIDTQLGLYETSAVEVTLDYNEIGSITPEASALLAINPDSDLIPVTRSNGVLTGVVAPSGGLVAGWGATVRLDGWTWEDMAIQPRSGLFFDWPRVGFAKSADRFEELDALVRDARRWSAAREADPTVGPDARFNALLPVLEKEAPAFIRADSAPQIETAVAFGARHDINVVIVGGDEAMECVETLLAHDIPVVVHGTHRMPGRRDELWDHQFTLPGRLNEAGVKVAIAANERYTGHERNLPYHAGTAAAHGMDPHEALRTVTEYAAEVIGLGEVLGTIEVGKYGTVIVTNGDPLEVTTNVSKAFIEGRQIELDNRQTQLRDKYLQKYRRQGRLD